MDSFRKNEIQVLLSTTVVEVGVDVPNANLIIIEHAERFGLSQLHQLRGRVGRGQWKGYCALIASPEISSDSWERLQKMELTTDGFELAEWDLEWRGPGELLGKRQSGLSGFKMAHILRDQEILVQARSAVEELLRKDPHLDLKENQKLKLKLEDFQKLNA
jgi:ATP-dependent DNA helicase RecG